MKKKIKLRDMTEDQLEKWSIKNCNNCDKCPLNGTDCGEFSWIDHKDLYSDKFLDREVEIDVPDILDKEEHDYLEAVIKPWRERVKFIKKYCEYTTIHEFIVFVLNTNQLFSLPSFNAGEMYKGMKRDKGYTLEELGL